MPEILPPPSVNVPAVQDRHNKTMDFTPVWYRWFIDLVRVLNKGGGTDGGIPATRKVNTRYSLEGGGDLTEDRTLNLVGDEASPGPSKGYSTDASGVRGWHDLPTGTGVGGVVFVAEAVVTGVPAQSLTVTGLDLDAAEQYELQVDADVVTTSIANISLYVNEVTTMTQYWTSTVQGSGTTVGSNRVNAAYLMQSVTSTNGPVKAEVVLRRNLRGYPSMHTDVVRGVSSNLLMFIGHIVASFAANVTSITLMSDAVNQLTVGTRIRVYRRTSS